MDKAGFYAQTLSLRKDQMHEKLMTLYVEKKELIKAIEAVEPTCDCPCCLKVDELKASIE